MKLRLKSETDSSDGRSSVALFLSQVLSLFQFVYFCLVISENISNNGSESKSLICFFMNVQYFFTNEAFKITK